MTHLPLRIWLITSLGLITGACAHSKDSLDMRVYRLRLDGLHRRLETLPLEQALGYYCMSPRDFELLILRSEMDQEMP